MLVKMHILQTFESLDKLLEITVQTGVLPMFLLQVTFDRALPARSVRSAKRSAQSAHQIFDIFVDFPENIEQFAL